MLKKLFRLLISLCMMVSLVAPISYAKEPSDILEEEITINDIDFEPGQVDMDSLPNNLKNKLEKRMKEIDAYFEALGQAKVDLEVLQQKQTINRLSKDNNKQLLDAKQRFDYLKNNPEEIVGLTRLDTEDQQNTIQPLSTIADVSVNQPSMYYDNDSKLYVMSGRWTWNRTYPDNNTNGMDGFGLKTVQRRISSFDSGLRTYNQSGTRTYHSLSKEVGNYGIGMMFQETGVRNNYSAFSGNGWLYFKWYDGTPVGRAINYRSVLAHSWGSSSLTGFNIGATSFGLEWSSKTNAWSKENYNVIQF